MTLAQGARLASSAWGVGAHTLLMEKGIRGNALCTHLLTQASVGLALSRRARWPYLCRPGGCLGVIPTKTPGCLHHSRWRSSVFVEHFAQVSYTLLVFKALPSYRYSFVSRQSICILSFTLPYHRVLTDSAVWGPPGSSPLAILLSHLSTQIRCADSMISILYSRFLAASGLLLAFRKLARLPPRTAPSDAGMSPSYLHLHSAGPLPFWGVLESLETLSSCLDTLTNYQHPFATLEGLFANNSSESPSNHVPNVRYRFATNQPTSLFVPNPSLTLASVV